MKKLTTLFIFAIMLMSLSLSAHTHYRTLTPAMNNGHFYYCIGDTLVVEKPIGSGIGSWYPGANPPAQVGDSLILTQASQLFWEFTSGSITILFTIHFVSISPAASWNSQDTSKCTENTIVLHAQTNPQPDFTYTWSTTATTPTINATTPGIYKVTVTGACATTIDSINVINYPVPAPNLGHDTNTCDGNTITLTPGSFTSYLWNTNAITPTINVTTAGTYSVTVTDLHGCHGRDTIGVTFIMNNGEEIYLLTIDSTNGNNQVRWKTTNTTNITTKIYRGSSAVLVGTTNYGDGRWTDIVNSVNQTWTYRIATINGCNNESIKSQYHTTISTAVMPIVGGGYRLEWTPYFVGSKSVANYDIFSTSGFGINWILTYIATVDSNVLSYNLTTMTDSMFVVGAEVMNGSKTVTAMALSNVVENPLFSSIKPIVAADNISIYPNPSTGAFFVSANGTISIYDVLGNFVLSTEAHGKIGFQLNSGIYLIKILQDKSTTTQKIVVQ